MTQPRRDSAQNATRRRESGLKIRPLSTRFARLLIAGSLILCLFAATLAWPRGEASATSDCAYLLTKATTSKFLGDRNYAAGDFKTASRYYETAVAYYTLYNGACF
jgi:hypothetical protein